MEINEGYTSLKNVITLAYKPIKSEFITKDKHTIFNNFISENILLILFWRSIINAIQCYTYDILYLTYPLSKHKYVFIVYDQIFPSV